MAIQSFQLDPNAQAYADLNALDPTANTKLVGIEANATADQTGAEIKTAYEGNANTNAYPDADSSKLAGVEASATADQTGDEMVTAIDAGSTSITRGTAVDASAMDLIKTNAVTGEFKVKALQRDSGGNLDVEYDDVVVP